MQDHLFISFREVAIDVVKQSGNILKQFWGQIKEIREKDYPGDLVTEADQASEQIIVQGLKRYFPDHQILAEESGFSMQSSDFLWIIDPLDGTTNYAHQYPLCAISIGLLYKQEPILGIIYNPIQDELFLAMKEKGAWLNDKPIYVSKIDSLSQSLLGTGFAYDRRQNADNNYAEFCHFTNLSQGVRRGGSAALDLAYVAAGRLDGYWERGLKPWDIAAGIIIVQEAGGKVTDYNLSSLNLESGRILATNGLLHEAMSRELIDLKKMREIYV